MAEASSVLTMLRWGGQEVQTPPGDLLTALQVEMRGTEDHQREDGQKPPKSSSNQSRTTKKSMLYVRKGLNLISVGLYVLDVQGKHQLSAR